jgi:hypothetical protein
MIFTRKAGLPGNEHAKIYYSVWCPPQTWEPRMAPQNPTATAMAGPCAYASMNPQEAVSYE